MAVKCSDLEMRLAEQILYGTSRFFTVPKFLPSPSEIKHQAAILKTFMEVHLSQEINFQSDQIQQLFDQAIVNLVKVRIAEIRDSGKIELPSAATASISHPKLIQFQNMAAQAVHAGVKAVNSLIAWAETTEAEKSTKSKSAEAEPSDEQYLDWDEIQLSESPEQDAFAILTQWESNPLQVAEIVSNVYVKYLKTEVLKTAINLKI